MQKDIHEIHDQVRDDYRQILLHPKDSVLSGEAAPDTVSASVGYTPEELASVPPEANLGLGCGNPLRAAGLQPGEVVIDLGSGPGLDCFLAGLQVGPRGRVIGVDMTPEMLSTARQTAKSTGSGTWSSVWGRSKTCRRRTILPTSAFPTASSTCLR